MYKTHVLIPNEKRKFIYSEAPEKQPPTMPLKQAVNTTVKKEKDTKKSKCFGLFSSGDKKTCSPWLWLLIIPIIFLLHIDTMEYIVTDIVFMVIMVQEPHPPEYSFSFLSF